MVIKLYATLRQGRGKEADIPWYEGLDGVEILKALELKPEDVKIFLINGLHSKPETKIKPDDVISLFPAVGGG